MEIENFQKFQMSQDVHLYFFSPINDLQRNHINSLSMANEKIARDCYLLLIRGDVRISINYKLSLYFVTEGSVIFDSVEFTGLGSTGNETETREILENVNQNVEKIEDRIQYHDLGYIFPAVLKKEWKDFGKDIHIGDISGHTSISTILEE